MANAIKKISVQRGYDVTRYALNCFGGAGGQHACLVADALGMTTVLIHPFSSLLSAYGMGLADIRATRQQAIEEAFGAKSLADARARSRSSFRKTSSRRSRRPGRRREGRHGVRARAHPLRRHRHRAGGEGRLARGDEIRVREGPQGAVRLHRSQEGPRHRGGLGRSGRRRRRSSRRRRTGRRGRSSPRLPAGQNSSPTANGTTRPSTPATSCPPATR